MNEELARAAVTALQTLATHSGWTWVEVAGVVVALVVGAGQCGLIWWGVQIMKGSSTERARQLDAQQHQHEATMEALRQQQDAQQHQHEATMEALHQQRDAQQHQHEESMTALKVLIERTAPPRPAAD